MVGDIEKAKIVITNYHASVLRQQKFQKQAELYQGEAKKPDAGNRR